MSTINETLTVADDKQHLFPINYAYDCLQDTPIRFEHPTLKYATDAANFKKSIHGIDLFPDIAGLSNRTALRGFRQSKHWKAAFAAGASALEHFVNDASSVESSPLQYSYAAVAKKLLEAGEDGFLRFSIYMFPEADEHRSRLLAISYAFIFTFDDVWEMQDEKEVQTVQADFIVRLKNEDLNNNPVATTPLQAFINNTNEEFRKLAATGGQEVMDLLVAFCQHPTPPPEAFHDLGSYLAYRREDAAIPYVYACAKFSLASTVNLKSPKFQQLFKLLGDHMALANDLQSYDKEKIAYDRGITKDLINAVHIVQKVLNLSSEQDAKAITYALQLQVECDIDAEVKRLQNLEKVSEEEWHFVRAILLAAAGNQLSPSVISRYGGQRVE